MKNLIAAAILFLSITVIAGEKFDTPLEQVVKTSIGELTTEKDNENDTASLLLNGKTILKHDGGDIFLSEVIPGKTKQFVVVVESSGGNGCAGDYVVMEIQKTYTFSKSFINCSEQLNAKAVGDSLILTFPSFIAHPELRSKANLAKEKKAVTIYTWKNGKITVTKK